jgi:putative Holliday junction resolvase
VQSDSKNKGRVLAIDYGSKRVGVAVSDPLQIIARGVGTLDNDGALLERLGTMVRADEVVRIVVGMPYAADGGLGAKAREVQSFIARLRAVVTVPIDTWDESYTSVRAHETFRAAGMKKKQRQQKARVDEMAARLMLQEYLESSVG